LRASPARPLRPGQAQPLSRGDAEGASALPRNRDRCRGRGPIPPRDRRPPRRGAESGEGRRDGGLRVSRPRVGGPGDRRRV